VSDYDNTNSGALFKNDDKQSEKHPDYRGQINVNGEEFWLSAWVKTSKKGQKFMSLSVQPKESRASSQREREQVREDLDDDLPF
jgi:uncharacterized protein (DUF736 family)